MEIPKPLPFEDMVDALISQDEEPCVVCGALTENRFTRRDGSGEHCCDYPAMCKLKWHEMGRD